MMKLKLIVIISVMIGFLHEDDINFICSNNKNVFIDTKEIWKMDKERSFIKINDLEYKNIAYH